MPTPTFDGDNLWVILPAGEPVLIVERDLYSEWKVWVALATNARFPQAFTTEGGQPTEPGETLGPVFFFRNDLGWRVRPAEEDADVVFDGSLFFTDTTLDWQIPTLGAFTVSLRIKFSNLSLVKEVPAPADDAASASQIAAILSQEPREATTIRTVLPGRRTS